MLSKNKQIDYLCPKCNSPDIRQGTSYGQNSGFCQNRSCLTWWPWKNRKKQNVNETYPKVKCPRKHPWYLTKKWFSHINYEANIQFHDVRRWFKNMHPLGRIAIYSLLFFIALFLFVLLTGQTFGQRCAKHYEVKSYAYNQCIIRLSRGEP